MYSRMKIKGLFGNRVLISVVSIVVVILALNSSSFAHGKKILRRVRTRQTGGYGYVNGVSGGYGQRFQQQQPPTTPSTTPQPQPSPEPQNADFGTTTEYAVEGENSNDEGGYGGGGSTLSSNGGETATELPQAQVGYNSNGISGGYDLGPSVENREPSSSSSTEISTNTNAVESGDANRNFQNSGGYGYNNNFNSHGQQTPEPRKQSQAQTLQYSTPSFEQIPALAHQPTPTRTQYEERLSQTSYYNNNQRQPQPQQQEHFGGYEQSGVPVIGPAAFSNNQRTRVPEQSYPAVPKASGNNNVEPKFPSFPQTPRVASGVGGGQERNPFQNENTVTFHGIGNDDESEMSFEGLNNSIVDEELLEKVQQIIAQHEREEREYFARLRARENENSGAPEQNLQQANIYSTQYQQPQTQTFSLNNNEQNDDKRLDEPPHHFTPSNPNIEFTPSVLTGHFSQAGGQEGRNGIKTNEGTGQRSGKQYLPPSPPPSSDTVVIGGVMQPMHFAHQNQRHFSQGSQTQEYAEQQMLIQHQAQQQFSQRPQANNQPQQQYAQPLVSQQYGLPQASAEQYSQPQPQNNYPQTQSQMPQQYIQTQQYHQPQVSQQYSQPQQFSHSQQYSQQPSQPQQNSQQQPQAQQYGPPQAQSLQYSQPQPQPQQYMQFYNVPQFPQHMQSQPQQEQYSGITMAYFLTPEQAKSPFVIPEPQMIPSTFPHAQTQSQPEDGYNSNEQQSNGNAAGRQYLPPSAPEHQPQQYRTNLPQGQPALNYGVPTVSRTIVIHEHPSPFPTQSSGDVSQQRNRAIITPQDFLQPQQYGPPAHQSFESNELGPSAAAPVVPTPTYRFLQASTQLTVSNGEFGADNNELDKPKPIYGIPLAPVLEEPSGPSNYLPPSGPPSPTPTIESTHVLQAVYRLPQQSPSGGDRDHQQLQELQDQPQSEEAPQTYYGVPSFGQRRMLRKRYFNTRSI